MAIRPTELSWTNYKKAAKNLKLIKPGITPQQIIGRIGFPIKNGQRIFITSDGKGGVKQRNRTAHDARNAQRERRRRIQTGKLSPTDATESRRLKDQIRASGQEVDHFNEIAFIGEQLERLERAGGDVQAALKRLRDAGYRFGDEPGNLQPLSPEDNKLKNQQSQDLQSYLGSREALGQSPSARRPDLIVVGEDLSLKKTQSPGTQSQPGLKTTAAQSKFKPDSLGGFTGEERTPQVTPPTEKYTPPLVQQVSSESYNGNGNGASPPNGNGGNGDNYEQYLNPSPALQSIINDTFNYATHKTAPSLAEAAIKAGVGIVGFAKAVGSLALPYSP